MPDLFLSLKIYVQSCLCVSLYRTKQVLTAIRGEQRKGNMLLLLCLFSFGLAQDHLTMNYANTVDLTEFMTNGSSPTGSHFVLHYTVNMNKGNIDMAIVASTTPTGWVSFGLSEDGHMIPADVVVGWASSNGIFLTPFYASARTVGSAAGCGTTGLGLCAFADRGCKNNYQLRSITRDVYLTVEWHRTLNATGDVCSHSIIPNAPQFVIFAVGPTSSAQQWPYNLQYHTSRTNITTKPATFGFSLTFHATSQASSVPILAVPFLVLLLMLSV